jgi:molybdate transport system substrate-binding protein
MRILCAGAMHRIVDELMNALERLSGRPVAARFASSAAVKTRILEGECADVVITTNLAIEELGRHHKIVPGTTTDVARSSIGAAVRAGAARPHIGSIESFKRALRDANSIAIADPITGSPSGNHLVGGI